MANGPLRNLTTCLEELTRRVAGGMRRTAGHLYEAGSSSAGASVRGARAAADLSRVRPEAVRIADILARPGHTPDEVCQAVAALLDRKPHALGRSTRLVPGSAKVVDHSDFVNLPAEHLARAIPGTIIEVQLRNGNNVSPLLIVIQRSARYQDNYLAVLCPSYQPHAPLREPGKVLTAIKDKIASDPGADVGILSHPYSVGHFEDLTGPIVEEINADFFNTQGYRIRNPDHDAPLEGDAIKGRLEYGPIYVPIETWNLENAQQAIAYRGQEIRGFQEEYANLTEMYRGAKNRIIPAAGSLLRYPGEAGISPETARKIVCGPPYVLSFPEDSLSARLASHRFRSTD